MDINTIVSVAHHPPGKPGLPNITLQDAKFFGRPNFSGIENQFKDSRRQMTVVIPEDVADQLRAIGYNVKTTLPTEEQEKEGMEKISHLKVMIDDNSAVYFVSEAGAQPMPIATELFPTVDKTRFETWDCEIRAWNYNSDEVRAGSEEPKYSARLVTFIGVMRPNILSQKYGAIG